MMVGTYKSGKLRRTPANAIFWYFKAPQSYKELLVNLYFGKDQWDELRYVQFIRLVGASAALHYPNGHRPAEAIKSDLQ